MLELGLLATLEAKPGKGEDVAQFLQNATPLVEAELGTMLWFAFQIGPTTFGIFDAFKDDAARDAHLHGKVAEALMERAPELFAESPSIQKLELLAQKLPLGRAP